ncbi:MAG: hypothetical protein GTO45_31285 [Candidatus Aminicenantes bacterium]|nr:hypothetical protein [Candidatus Aminicenantes bacterium]NIM83283.1 hypothetical protein [Candidatus Aminicenantes bacterium]NIN22654.1 hypothetical protein [Candidatus Aminicenantes bacterium]NIN46413.1 hypothetical protein [Candidatus Aminicenantes bacterium]NIN89263.1 hypothetical protein [Candidatus Aminicenantes bacterium]
MRKASVFYFIISLVVSVYLVRFALGPAVFGAIAPQIPGLCFIIFPVIFLLLTHFSPAEIITAFKLAGRKSKGTKSELKNAVLFFKTARQFFITIAVIGMIILWIWYLAGGFDAGNGPPKVAAAVMILVGAFLYPLLFILFICLPFGNAVQKKLNESE